MRTITLMGIILLLGGAMAGYYFSDGQSKKRMTQASLGRFAEAVATKDRTKISATLGELLTDDASITLAVHFFSIGNQRPMMEQTFTKPQFIKFIDDTLYSLTDYSYTPLLGSVEPDTGTVSFTSGEWADGANMMGGIAVNMRYSSETGCTGRAVFGNNVARLQQASCKMQLRQVPKPGQEGQLTPERMRDLLQK